MRVLFDTNVVLDLLLDREPWSQTAAELFTKVESGTLDGYLCATTVTTIHYLATQSVGAKKAREEIRKLLALCAIAPVNRPVLEAALELDFADFEDAVLYEAARQVDAEAIVTLGRHPAVGACTVAERGGRLVAYVVGSASASADSSPRGSDGSRLFSPRLRTCSSENEQGVPDGMTTHSFGKSTDHPLNHIAAGSAVRERIHHGQNFEDPLPGLGGTSSLPPSVSLPITIPFSETPRRRRRIVDHDLTGPRWCPIEGLVAVAVRRLTPSVSGTVAL